MLLISVDTLRADHLSAYGYFRSTSPRIDRLARGALVYDRAFTVMNHTLPAHLSLLTGVDPGTHGVLDNAWAYVLGPYPTLAQSLRARGYATAAFVSGLPLRVASGLNAGFETYADTRAEDGSQRTRVPGETTAERALRWLAQPREAPFFLFVHFFDTHAPYRFPPGWEPRFRVDAPLRAHLAERGLGDVEIEDVSPVEVHLQGRRASMAELVNAYDNQIHRVDALVGELLDALETAGLAERTLVVVTSDHGEGLGDHGYYAHGLHLYEEQLRVPLIVRPPAGGSWRPGRVASAASLLDVPLTVLALAGAPPPDVAHGQPLRLEPGAPEGDAPRWLAARRRIVRRGSERHGRFAPDGPLHALRGDAGLKYLRWGRGREELYDLEADPRERRDLAAQRPEEAQRLRRLLDAELARLGAEPGETRLPTGGDEAETGALLEQLGYIQ